MADGSKAATLVSGRCLYGIASLREELTRDERFAEDIKNLNEQGKCYKASYYEYFSAYKGV